MQGRRGLNAIVLITVPPYPMADEGGENSNCVDKAAEFRNYRDTDVSELQ